MLRDVEMLKGLWGQNGEVLLTEPRTGWEDVKVLQDWAPILSIKFSKDEILAKMEDIDMRKIVNP